MNNSKIKHLYARAGFGLNKEDLESLNTLSLNAVVSSLFFQSKKTNSLKLDLSEFEAYQEMASKELGQMEEKALRAFRKKSRQKVRELNYAWINRLVNTNSVLREKMTLFWANVFVCKDNTIWHIQQYNNTLRSHALGNFGDLAKAVAKEPSMSKYLNNKQNIKNRPNENFARELMELFTLGIGNYTEQDIKEGARAFTGWSFTNQGDFYLREKKHDFGSKTFLGETGNFTGEDIIDIILKQKDCAKFICTKVYKYFVNPDINESQLEEITNVFYKDYDIENLMRYIFTSSWFYDEKNIGIKIKSPIELLVGIKKTIPLTFIKKNQELFVQKMMGQILLNPPNVAGWKQNKNWIDSNTLMFRMKLASLLLNNGLINFQPKGEFEDSFKAYYKDEKKEHYFKIQPDWEAFNKNYGSYKLNDFVSLLIHSPIDADTNQLLSALQFTNNKELAIQVMSIPEYQLC